MRLTLCFLVALLGLALPAPAAPACNPVVPASALAAPAGYGCGVPAAAPVLVQQAPVLLQRSAGYGYGVGALPLGVGALNINSGNVVGRGRFFGRSFAPAGAAFGVGAPGSININSGNVGRRRFFR